ncbi:unnamed protein product [Parnassius apollo]|uniref:(apollo) hypothetical protein n=1 Tax=Parnassius apollo TaxID=110799 RepID=A0A8S3VZ18_PARAO|nr:unnamed protein product [Parnassius apollo]
MNAFVTILAVVIVAVAAETRDKRGALVSHGSLHAASLLTSPYLSAYGAAPLLSSHALHSPLLGAHSLYSSPYLAGSPYLSASSLYGSYYSPSLYGSPYLTPNSLYGSYDPLLNSLSSPHAHTPQVIIVKTSPDEHSSSGHSKHESEHKSGHH